jgi:hypothetical protein
MNIILGFIVICVLVFWLGKILDWLGKILEWVHANWGGGRRQPNTIKSSDYRNIKSFFKDEKSEAMPDMSHLGLLFQFANGGITDPELLAQKIKDEEDRIVKQKQIDQENHDLATMERIKQLQELETFKKQHPEHFTQ